MLCYSSNHGSGLKPLAVVCELLYVQPPHAKTEGNEGRRLWLWVQILTQLLRKKVHPCFFLTTMCKVPQTRLWCNISFFVLWCVALMFK